MNIKNFIFILTAFILLIITCSCSNKSTVGSSSISAPETSSLTSENVDTNSSSYESENTSDNSDSNNSKSSSSKKPISNDSSSKNPISNDSSSKKANSNKTSSFVNGSSSKPQKDNSSKSSTSSKPISIPNRKPINSSSSISSITSGEKAELDEDIYNTLLDELETATPRELRFYSVKNTVFASTSYVPLDTVSEIIKHYESTASFDDIMSFKDNLMLSKWEAKKFNLHTQPSLAIYFSESLHMNLEFQSKDVSWISICSPIGKSYYVVPEDVYIDILDFYHNIDQ